MSQKVEGRPDLSRREKHPIEMIMVACSEIYKSKDELKKRLYMADPKGQGWRGLNCALGLLMKAQRMIYDTVPPRQLEQLRTICEAGVVTLNINPALLPKGYTAVEDGDLNVICAAAVNEACSVCVADSRECQSCQLRKSLLRIWPPKEFSKYGRCPYQDVTWASDATVSLSEEENK